MQNRFWISMAVIDIFLACISITYIGNRRENANMFRVDFMSVKHDKWIDAIKDDAVGCNESCTGACHVNPVVSVESTDNDNYLFQYMIFLSTYAFICGVGILGLVSEQVNCMQNCVMQFVLGFLFWVCAGWSYQWGSLPFIILSVLALTIQSFTPLYFSNLWKHRVDISFALMVLGQTLVSLPTLLCIFNFSGKRVDSYFIITQSVQSIIIVLQMLAMYIAAVLDIHNTKLNIVVMLITFAGLFYHNIEYVNGLKSSDALLFFIPLYMLVTLSSEIRFAYGMQVLLHLAITMCVLYELN